MLGFREDNVLRIFCTAFLLSKGIVDEIKREELANYCCLLSI